MVNEPKFVSEELEPFAAMIMGRLLARVRWAQEYKDSIVTSNYCADLWYAAIALNKLSIVTHGAIHFSLAAMNNLTRTANMIEGITGIRPTDNGV